MKTIVLIYGVGVVLGVALAFATVYQPNRQIRTYDYATFKPEKIPGTNMLSVGSTASGRQLYVREGAVTHAVVQPTYEGTDDWEVRISFGSAMQRYIFPDEATARSNLQKFWDFIATNGPVDMCGCAGDFGPVAFHGRAVVPSRQR